MDSHAHFDLRVHTTAELEAVLDAPIVERVTLHEWPLSSVERVTLAGGLRWIYKTQHAPSVEAEFYRTARSPLLPACRVLADEPPYTILLLEYLNGATLAEAELDEPRLVATGRELLAGIRAIEGEPPVYLDVSTPDRWRALAEATLATLASLIADGRFVRCHREDVRWLAGWCAEPALASIVETTAGLTHGDLKADNLLSVGDRWHVLDWQRPQRAPREVDLVDLLLDGGFDPLRYVDPAVVGVRWFLHLHWAVEAKAHLLPEIGILDVWAEQAIRGIRTAAEAAATD